MSEWRGRGGYREQHMTERRINGIFHTGCTASIFDKSKYIEMILVFICWFVFALLPD